MESKPISRPRLTVLLVLRRDISDRSTGPGGAVHQDCVTRQGNHRTTDGKRNGYLAKNSQQCDWEMGMTPVRNQPVFAVVLPSALPPLSSTLVTHPSVASLRRIGTRVTQAYNRCVLVYNTMYKSGNEKEKKIRESSCLTEKDYSELGFFEASR